MPMDPALESILTGEVAAGVRENAQLTGVIAQNLGQGLGVTAHLAKELVESLVKAAGRQGAADAPQSTLHSTESTSRLGHERPARLPDLAG